MCQSPILVKSLVLIPNRTNYYLVHLKQLRNHSLSMGFTCLHYLLSIVNRIAGILFYPCRVVVWREREREREIEWFVGLADCNERFQAFDLVMSWWVFQPILWLVK